MGLLSILCSLLTTMLAAHIYWKELKIKRAMCIVHVLRASKDRVFTECLHFRAFEDENKERRTEISNIWGGNTWSSVPPYMYWNALLHLLTILLYYIELHRWHWQQRQEKAIANSSQCAMPLPASQSSMYKCTMYIVEYSRRYRVQSTCCIKYNVYCTY